MRPEDTLMPSNLHICATSRASTAAPLPERVEQKFFVTPDRMASAMALLRRTCRAAFGSAGSTF